MIDPQKAQPSSLMVEQSDGAFSSLVGNQLFVECHEPPQMQGAADK